MRPNPTLVVNEIFLSVQGESTWAGLPCVFIRLTGCDLRCSYCDTAYAFREGRRWSFEEIFGEVHRLGSGYAKGSDGFRNGDPPGEPVRLPLVELTGGEPLLQHNTPALMTGLCDEGYTVLVETSGAHDISKLDPRVHRIMDLKCPSSGECDRNRFENIAVLRPADEVKFVIGTEEDYAWAKAQVKKHGLPGRCPILFSWVHPLAASQQDASLNEVPEGMRPMTRQALAERLLADRLPVRFQVQMHKVIWSPERKGV